MVKLRVKATKVNRSNRSKLYPLKFKPIYKELIWGGKKLREYFNRDIPEGKRIGESWELADLPNDKSIIVNGPLAGQTIRQVISKFPLEMTGDKNFRGPFPLLIKFIDTEQLLSVQVHPDEEACRKIGAGVAKTECWYIVQAADGAVIYKGLKRGVTKKRFEQAIKNGTVVDLLMRIPVKAGQGYLLPAGTVHSIGPGILIVEIQTPSETTYRIFDWNRVDASGKPRPLHITEALASINFDNADEKIEAVTKGDMVSCEYFQVCRQKSAEDSPMPLKAGQMQTIVILKGCGVIKSSETVPVEITAGDTLLIPAIYEGEMRFFAETEYLKITI